MKKLTCFAVFLLLLVQYNTVSAQTCSADFTPVSGSNKTVTFYPTDSIGTSHRWLFGDGSSVTTTSFTITHAYPQPGQYLVVHYIERPGTTCHDSVVKKITIPADSCSITAAFKYWKDSLDCKKIHFINTSSPISPNVHFSWSFGDGTGSTDINPVHTYTSPGTYLVSLVSEAGTNCRRQVWDTVYVKCSVDSCSITAKFQYWKDSLNCKKIHFVNTSSPISPNVHFSWSFGDGTGSTDINPVHTYASPGTYLVSLVSRTADSNCRRQVWDSVVVKCADSCALHPLFTWTRDSLMGGNIRFTNIAPVAGVHYTWYFGDSSALSHDISPLHIYAHSGTYMVCLVAEAGNNCRRQYCQKVIVDKMLNGPTIVTAVPNPAINSVTIDVTLDRPELVIIRILDGSGIIKAVFSKTGTTGNNRFTLPVERLSRGIYLVEIHTGTRRWFSRFQKG